jgi:hypothetical protein
MNAEPQSPETNAGIESDVDFFAKSGPLPTAFNERRRFPRFYYRARIGHSSAGRDQPLCFARATGTSGRRAVVHTEQLYPGQRIDLVLDEGSPRAVEVMWCRRIADRSYSIGCRFLKAAESGDSQAPPAEAS